MLKPGDFVRYLGHTTNCPGKDCCDLMDAPFLINKIMQVISVKVDAEHPGLMVEYGGNNYGFFETHVQLVHETDDRYQAGVQEGLRIAAEIAEKGCACVTKDWRDSCCAIKAAKAIVNRIPKNGEAGG